MKMDVIHPKLAWVKGRFYRISEVYEHDFQESGNSNDCFTDAPVPVTTTNTRSDDEASEAEFEVQMTENGQYFTSFEIPNAIRGIVIGSKGATKKRIETETNTSIRFPLQGYEGDVTIKGCNRKVVAAARRRIEVMANSARRRHEPTHFLSLPLNDPKIIKAFGKFKETIMEKFEKERGITSQTFQTAEKLHLTIGTLVLLSAKERSAASRVLADCADRIVKPLLKHPPLMVKVKGIEYMNDDPAEVNVLYAKVFAEDEPESLLQDLANKLMNEFVTSGMMNKEYESIKLHATVINSIFNKGQYKGSLPCKTRETFDARMIMKHFSDFDFGSCCINAVHLSQRHTEGNDGYYSSTSILQLPV